MAYSAAAVLYHMQLKGRSRQLISRKHIIEIATRQVCKPYGFGTTLNAKGVRALLTLGAEHS